LRSLLQNQGKLAPLGVSVPGPGRYRESFVKSAEKLAGDVASPETQDMLLDSVLDNDEAQRVIISHENFVCMPTWVFENGKFYTRAAYKPLWLRNLFADHDVEFFVAIRNPATLLPALLAHRWQEHSDLAALLQGAPLSRLKWAPVIDSIRKSCPDVPLTVWSNEDTPYIWPEVLGAVTGVSSDVPLKGGLNIAGEIMNKEGYRRLRTYLINNPPHSDRARHKIISAFVEKYALPEAIELEIDIPELSAELIETITDAYESELDDIAAMDGVRFIST
jgi:hypothetical protein